MVESILRCYGSNFRFGDWWLYGNGNVGVLLRNKVTGEEIGGKTQEHRKAVLNFVQELVKSGVQPETRFNSHEWRVADNKDCYWNAQWLFMRANTEGDD